MIIIKIKKIFVMKNLHEITRQNSKFGKVVKYVARFQVDHRDSKKFFHKNFFVPIVTNV
ncbi:hypothetical protein C1645_747076 [Glomus cerebriforme]|uniref:Uncharacterized protein n=1 Tax=Glomus cerebriforme TaxID=658196 RepID=A0A397TQ44_9GLOM|nr:hypothetical protein C1645_747076 [Glomus cerebriforme]